MYNPLELYRSVFISQSWKRAIFQDKKGKVFLAYENEVKELPYTKIVDKSKDMIRFYNIVEGVKKWGILHITGSEKIPPIYDYISPLIADKFFRVFVGDYKWKADDYSQELFNEYLFDTNSWNGDYYKGTLKQGKWGIINTENKVIIPIEYDWVELIDDQTACCNVGGSPIIKWFHGDKKENIISKADGLYRIIYLSDSLKIESVFGSYDEALKSFNEEYAKLFIDPHNYQFHAYNWQKIHRFSTENKFT